MLDKFWDMVINTIIDKKKHKCQVLLFWFRGGERLKGNEGEVSEYLYELCCQMERISQPRMKYAKKNMPPLNGWHAEIA